MRARQRQVTNVLRELIAPDFFRHQWMHVGQSRRNLISSVRSLAASARWSHVAVLDIADFFGSLSHDYLRSYLPFTAEVVNHTIIYPLNHEQGGPALNNDERRSIGTSQMASLSLNGNVRLTGNQRGLAQGASCSPLIAYSFLETVLAGLSSDCPILQWGDDIVIFGRSAAEIRDTSLRLNLLLRNNSAGPLTARIKYDGPIRSGFAFHGHTFVPFAGQIAVTLTDVARDRFFENVEERIGRDCAEGDVTFETSYQYIDAWLTQALCDERFDLTRRALDRISDAGN